MLLQESTCTSGLKTNMLKGRACLSIQVLKRINSEIQARRQAGENLPPPPKTAIAGPEYFGLNQPEVGLRAVEILMLWVCSQEVRV